MAPNTLIANKKFILKGKSYKPGEPVDIKGLPVNKVNQLLDQRWLRPAEEKL